MTRRTTKPGLLLVGGALVGALAVGAAAAFVLAPGSLSDVVVPTGGVVLALVFVLAPRTWLPALALVLFVLLPQQLTGYLSGASPAALALAVWAVRTLLDRGPTGGRGWLVARVSSATILAWALVLVVLVGTVPPEVAAMSSNWIVAFSLGIVLPLLAGRLDGEALLLWRVWPILTVAIALYALIEFVLGSNPLYGRAYEFVGRGVDQEWAVYRSHASFGHPLYAATFFATSAAASLGRAVLGQGRRSWLWLMFALGGVTLTVSRSALLAVALAAAVVVIAALVGLRPVRRPGLWPSVLLLGLGAAGVLGAGVIEARADSVEAGSSSDARTAVTDIAFAAVRDSGWLGTGAGTADHAIGAWNDQGYFVESSPLQILVSLGVVGVAATAVLVLAALTSSLAARNLPALGALVAFGVTISGYNAIESVLPMHAMLGLVLLLALSPGVGSRPDPVDIPVMRHRAVV